MNMVSEIAYVDEAYDPLILRDMRNGDAAVVRGIHRITFAEHVAREDNFSGQAPFVDEFIDDLRTGGEIKGFLGKRRTSILVAQLGDRVIGYVAYRCAKYPGLPVSCHIADISVAPEYRRAGLGDMLLPELEYRESQARHFLAGIWPGNAPSQALFEKHGYTLDAPHGHPYLMARKSRTRFARS